MRLSRRCIFHQGRKSSCFLCRKCEREEKENNKTMNVNMKKSYSILNGKKVHHGYDKERKVKNRTAKEAKRGKYFYARSKEFKKENNKPNDNMAIRC